MRPRPDPLITVGDPPGPPRIAANKRKRDAMDDSLDDWFAREILVHEGALESFLRRAWPNRDEIHDLRQEAYVRVYEAAARSRPTTPRAFLFTTARHLVTDRKSTSLNSSQ